MTATHRHVLRLAHGALVVSIVESDPVVFVGVSGARPTEAEASKVSRFLWSLLYPYRNDTRPFEFAGERVPFTAKVFDVGGNCWAAVVDYNAGRSVQ